MIPGRAGRNQTRLSKGTWEGVDTISGVICISVNCHFFLLKKIHTNIPLSASKFASYFGNFNS